MQLFAAILALLVLASLVFFAGFATGSFVVRKKLGAGTPVATPSAATPGTTSW